VAAGTLGDAGDAVLTTASAKNRPKVAAALLEVAEIGCGLRAPKFEDRNGATGPWLLALLLVAILSAVWVVRRQPLPARRRLGRTMTGTL
jgi:hypothetical protein